LERVLDAALSCEWLGVVEAAQERELLADLGLRLQRDEAQELALAGQDAAAAREERAVEAHVATAGGEAADVRGDRRAEAGVEVDRGARDRERVDPVGME